MEKSHVNHTASHMKKDQARLCRARPGLYIPPEQFNQLRAIAEVAQIQHLAQAVFHGAHGHEAALRDLLVGRVAH